jgi:putative addiction module CopG family antidote
MNVTLKPDAEKLVREKIQRGEFKNASDLVDEAIHHLLDMDEAEAELEALVRDGIESGPASEATWEDFDQIRRKVHAKHSSNSE